MPLSWRRPLPPREIFNPFAGVKSTLGKSVSSLKGYLGATTRMVGRVAPPVLGASIVLGLLYRFRKTRFHLPTLPDFSSLAPRKPSIQRSRKESLNLKYLEKLHNPNVFDSISVRSKALAKRRP